MAHDKRPHAQKLVVRGTMLLLMAVSLPFFGVLCIVLLVDSLRTQAGVQDILWGVAGAIGAPILLWLGIKTALGGIRADSRGVQIRNVWSKHYIPWGEVKDVIIHQMTDEGVGAYVLHFQLAEGYVASTFPEVWVSGKLLERPRRALLRLRDDALGRRTD